MPVATLEHDIARILHGEHADPFSLLGMHRVARDGEQLLVVRAFLPKAAEAWVVHAESQESTPLECIHPDGFFEATFADGHEPFPYRLRVRTRGEEEREIEDPYSFPSVLSDFDLYLLGEGTDLRMYDKLGAHPRTIRGVQGVAFAVWAPNAARVSVVGNFNEWDGRRHVMRLHPGVGVWEVFIPKLEVGTVYKYEIKPRRGVSFLKSDPVAFFAELRPNTASIVYELGRYSWGDGDWMAQRRANSSLDGPMSIYEVHIGSWRRPEVDDPDPRPNYREVAHELADYVTEMGFTHVELLPVMEHPYDPSWGYQVTGYFAPTSRYGAPDDFKYFVDHLHQRGIGVLLDWVPAHFPRDAPGLRRFDGTPLYEHEDPRRGEHPDWGTMVFNYGRNEVRNFLRANALFWLDEYHIDGLRVDAVASMLYLDYSRPQGQWIPNPFGGRENLEAIDFLKQLNGSVREYFPGALMIAEESTAWPGVSHPIERGGLGFHLKWNMGWMNDYLRFMEQDPVFRKYNFNLVTFSLMYAFSERFILPFSHDEVVHGKGSLMNKMPGDPWRKAANLRLVLGMMWAHPGKQLLFMGGELGEWREWSEGRSLDWNLLDYPLHAGMQRWVRDLNALYRREPAFWQRDYTYEGFEWIDFHDFENSVVSFMRRGDNAEEELLFVCNFTPVPRMGYRVSVPRAGHYRELLNSDSEYYGGSNLGNSGGLDTEPIAAQNRSCSLCLVLPPLSIVVLKRETPEETMGEDTPPA
ncbi:MAG TPA: 1,4-alpha-glucan branching protein GlgB [Longimicrobiaceae bacterium]|nr:1,4-alpha-glucan branching protein GlgB [Longimicrobiaceae bacterium]